MLFELRMLGYRFLKAFMKPVVKLVPQPRPVVFLGPDSALRLCRMISEFGLRRVLIVTDATLVRLGLIAPLSRALFEGGIDVMLFDGILPDPTYPVVREEVTGSSSGNRSRGCATPRAGICLAGCCTDRSPETRWSGTGNHLTR